LLRVRWWLVCGQAAIVAVSAWGLGIELPIGRLAALILATAATNALAPWMAGRVPVAHLGGSLLLFDVLQLTAVLYATGGPLNPFSMMFLVYITLAAVVLGGRWTWTITIAAAAGFGMLFVAPMDEHSAIAHALSGQGKGHLQGMWWAFAAAAILTAVFVVRLSREIDERDRQLEIARERAARTERLASLTTLAAGAAHELGTPLATIAVAAGELERALTTSADSPPEALEDVRLIREQLTRARDILDRMSRRAGDSPGEMPDRQALANIVAQATTLIAPDQRPFVSVEVPDDLWVRVPRIGLSESVAAIIRNGLEANVGAADNAPSVHIAASRDRATVTLTITDNGAGMEADVLTHVGEPFFTTKSPGQGMGLGVFLARLLVTNLGGDLAIASTEGSGTTVTIRLPWADPS
jgi:two-component system sensor histidine kinase RegB